MKVKGTAYYTEQKRKRNGIDIVYVYDIQLVSVNLGTQRHLGKSMHRVDNIRRSHVGK